MLPAPQLDIKRGNWGYLLKKQINLSVIRAAKRLSIKFNRILTYS